MKNIKFAKNIKQLRKSHNLNQEELAKILKMSTATSISLWENGKVVPNNKRLLMIANYFGITVENLLYGDVFYLMQNNIPLDSSPEIENTIKSAEHRIEKLQNILALAIDPNNQNNKQLPILGCISAGLGILAENNIEDYFEIDKSINADFILRIKGDSMIDAGINDGDLAFIKIQEDVENGQIAAVLINTDIDVESRAVLKRIHKNNGMVMLTSENKAYNPIILKEGDDITILGKLVSVMHNY